MKLSRTMVAASVLGVSFLLVVWQVTAVGIPPRAAPGPIKTAGERPADHPGRSGALELRIGVETLINPFWYADTGRFEEARQFWDREHWERVLRGWVDEGYNAVLYWVEPWNKHGWQTFLVKYQKFPEARALSAEHYDRVIAQANWIFGKAHELGLKNFLFTYSIVTTPEFARAHGLEKLPVSATVDFRHTLGHMGPHFGVRNELTRAFTEAAVTELFRTYPALDGLHGTMGEAVPGKRSTWYPDAIVPGLKATGRQPIFLVASWMQPFEDFLADMAPAYRQTWLSLHSNAEMFTDAKPYPTYVRWLEHGGVPAVVEIMHHNFEQSFPFNSPQLAWEIIHECRKFDSCRGILAWFSRNHPDELMRKALAYYAAHPEPYADAPWLRLLEARFGDHQAAVHFLKAYNASARIVPELSALAWVPHDLGTSRILLLPYWYWTDEDPRWNYFASPSRGGVLLPLRYYAKVVARFGKQFRDNSGTEYARNIDHPGSQELFWGLGDYPTTPEAHMRNIRRLGDESLSEAEKALETVKTDKAKAHKIYRYMKAYKLLADYYERKVLAATAALIYSFGGAASYRQEAEQLADEAVRRYEVALSYIWEEIDRKSGTVKGHWLGDKSLTLPELIEREKQERKTLAALFDWPGKQPTKAGAGKDPGRTGPAAGTFAPEK